MRISVKGYKSIVDKKSINLNGLAIISGANSTGKSSFMQPFLILKQTVENNTDGDSLVINGENTNLTESTQIINRFNGENQFSVYVESEESKKKEESKATFTYTAQDGFTASEAFTSGGKRDIFLKRKMSKEEISAESVKIDILEDKTASGFFKGLNLNSDDFNWKIGRSKPFLTLELTPKNAKDKRLNFFSIGYSPNKRIESFVEDIIHVPGIRSNPERQYKLERYSTKYQGRFDKYIASIIYNWCKKKDGKLEKLKDMLSYIGLASNIEAKKINEAHISIDISRVMGSTSEDMVNLSDVGFGISQVLPVLVSLIEAKKKNIVFIEQPEIHLHPQAQFKLSKIVCDSVREGKKIIIETHSSIFIRGIQIEVAEKSLSPELFSLNWFSQNEKGNTEISEATLDENGAFGEWPSDFDDTYMNVEDRYLSAVENNMFSNLSNQSE